MKIDFEGKKYIATTSSNQTDHINNHIKNKENALVLIGPEGDFTKEELQIANLNKFKPLSLGISRLRTETAGVMVCAGVSLINN